MNKKLLQIGKRVKITNSDLKYVAVTQESIQTISLQ